MNEPPRIRVFCVDDHPLLREGIITLINNQPDMQVVGEASTGQKAIEGFREHRPDIALMDIRLPDMSGIDVMIAIRKEFPEARIIMLTTSEGDVEIQRALEAGASGYMLKSMPPKEVVEAVRQVNRGKKRIPPEIAAHIADLTESLHRSDVTGLLTAADHAQIEAANSWMDQARLFGQGALQAAACVARGLM